MGVGSGVMEAWAQGIKGAVDGIKGGRARLDLTEEDRA